ncbi:MAG: hypothetical protein ACTSRG_01695 [Candidatus Helarchaeota archaeon]
MPNPKNWILAKIKSNQELKYPQKKISHFKTVGYLSQKFKDALINAITEAFISGPLIEFGLKLAAKKGDDTLKNSFTDVVKRRFIDDMILYIFQKGGLGYNKTGYLEPYDKNLPYWIEGEADAKRFDREGNLLGTMNIRNNYIKYETKEPPTIDELSTTKLQRSNKSPENAPEILHPLSILPEAPFRHYHKLLEQTDKKNGNKLEVPFEIMFTIAPIFDHETTDELLELLKEYFEQDHSKKELPIPTRIPQLLRKHFPKTDIRPASSDWLLKNWNKIEGIIRKEANETFKKLDGFWIWILGVTDQKGVKNFVKIYQDDKIYMDIKDKDTVIWNSIIPPPYLRKYQYYLKKKEAGEDISAPEIDPEHPDYYLNNHTADVYSNDLKPLKAYF